MKNVSTVIHYALLFLLVFSLYSCSQISEKEQALLNEADKILQDVSKLIGQEITREVKKGFKDREQLVAILDTMMQKEYPPEKFHADEQMLKFFRFIPQSMNLEKKIKAFYLEQIGGFYNPETKELYLIRSGQIPMLDNPLIQKTMMAHELCHALQDMKIDLEKLLNVKTAQSSDQVVARLAVTEGQATVVMMQYLLNLPIDKLPDLSMMRSMMESSGETMGAGFEEFKNAPTYLKEKLALFPYMDGAVFYQAFLKKFPDIKPVDIFDHLPLSSEQILHFDKFVSKDYPQVLELEGADDIMGERWKLLKEEAFGEFDWRLYFTEHGHKPSAIKDAAGWDGANFYLYENTNDSSLAMIMLTTWDSENDVEEAKEAYKTVLAKKYPEAKKQEGKFAYRINNGDKITILIENGFDLLILEEIPVKKIDSVTKAAMNYKKAEIRN